MTLHYKTHVSILCTCLFSLVAGPSAAFDIDLKDRDAYRTLQLSILEDAEPFDISYIDDFWSCRSEDGLYLDPLAVVSDSSGVKWRVIKTQERTVHVTITRDGEIASADDFRAQIEGVYGGMSCSAYEKDYLTRPFQSPTEGFFKVEEIWNTKTISELLDKIDKM